MVNHGRHSSTHLSLTDSSVQELIGPREVVFLSKEWAFLGTKESLADLVEEITDIEHAVLTARFTVYGY